MAIIATNPIIIPAVSQQVFNEIWIKRLEVVATGCNGEPAFLNAIFGIVSRDENGVGVFNDEFSVTYNVPNIFMINNAEWLETLSNVISVVTNQAISDGALSQLFSPPS